MSNKSAPLAAKPQTSAEVSEALQSALADLIALSFHAKQAHWTVTGPLFRPLHELFDEIAESARGWYDDVAERLLALGVAADGRLSTVAKTAGIQDHPAGRLEDRRTVELGLERVERVAAGIRAKLPRVGESDLVTQDMLIGIVEGLEKQAWMLRAQRS